MTVTHESSRERILDAGAELFLREGYANTTLRKIGAEVGIKAASIYYHFASKDDLLSEILEIGMQSISEAFDERVPGKGDAHERFAAAVAAHLGALFDHGPYTAAHVTVFRRAPRRVKEKIIPLRDDYERRWDELLRSLVDDQVLRDDLDMGLARLTLLGSMNSALEWFDLSAGGSIDDLVNVIQRQFWSGMAAQDHKGDQ